MFQVLALIACVAAAGLLTPLGAQQPGGPGIPDISGSWERMGFGGRGAPVDAAKKIAEEISAVL